ncbi:hypothetical protein DVB69_14670 [Sporosarcina sp. BI001-red]|nr:hypothetical protein DVB69_14670 [Sporosarcina sp. BI001-red]
MKTPQERSDEETEIEPLRKRPPEAEINSLLYTTNIKGLFQWPPINGTCLFSLLKLFMAQREILPASIFSFPHYSANGLPLSTEG